MNTCFFVPWLHPLKKWSLRQSRGGSEFLTRYEDYLDFVESEGPTTGMEKIKKLNAFGAKQREFTAEAQSLQGEIWSPRQKEQLVEIATKKYNQVLLGL